MNATAFRTFFELPDDEWKWHFDVPGFDVRFIALDLNHISDMGTTWQACHPFAAGSEQFEWYDRLTQRTDRRFVVTLYNEQNASIRAKEGGRWHQMFRRGTICITGFGYFAERAVFEGHPYFNTSVSGRGDRYPDPALPVPRQPGQLRPADLPSGAKRDDRRAQSPRRHRAGPNAVPWTCATRIGGGV